MSGVSWTGRLWRKASSERNGGNVDGRSGWTELPDVLRSAEVLQPVQAEIVERRPLGSRSATSAAVAADTSI